MKMHKINQILLSVIIIILFLNILSAGSISSAGTPEETLQIQYFSFSFSAGMFMNSGNMYTVEQKENGDMTARVRLEGVYYEDAPEIPVDDAFLEQLSQILLKYDVLSWDGFQGSDNRVLDGDSFGLDLVTADDILVHAHGYMEWPKHYGEVKAELADLFISWYDSVYPNHMNILEDYYQTQILPGKEEQSLVEISYPYVAAEDIRFRYGQPDISDCILGHQFGNYTGGYEWDYDRDHSDMIVIYLDQEPSENLPDYNQSWIRFELYTLDDDLQVKLLGEDWVESNAFWNDGIYAYLFTHEYEGQSYLGYFSRIADRASGYSVQYTLYLYRLGEGGPELVEAEVLEDSLDRDTWSYDDLTPFIAIAESYGFTNSLKYWQDYPYDPCPATFDIHELLSLHTTTNYGKGFLDTLKATPVGDPIGDFRIDGEIRSLIP